MSAEAYICIEPFTVSKVDEDGYMVDNETVTAEKNSVWYKVEKEVTMVGGPDSIYLENPSAWIEVTPKRFQKHFRKLENA